MLVLSVWLAAACCAGCPAEGSVPARPDAPAVETTFVVDDSRAYNAWPGIHLLGDRLLVVYSHLRGHFFDGDDDKTSSLSRLSSDGARTWSAPVPVLFRSLAPDAWGPCGEQTIRPGDALFWSRYWNGDRRWHTLVRTADGVHYESIAKPKFDPMPVQIMEPVNVPGRGWVSIWFAGSYQHQEGHSWGLIISTDNGRHWTQQVVEKDLLKADWPTEPSLFRLGGTRLMALARCEQRCAGNPPRRLFSLTSEDLGRTWRRQLTNISDVLESTPSVFWDSATDELTLYYFHRGPGLLKRRTAKASAAFENPTVWSEPVVVACGRKNRDWDSGNVNAVRHGGSDYLAYYAGSEHVASVLVSVVGKGATPRSSWEGRRVLFLGKGLEETARRFAASHHCECHAYETLEAASVDFPKQAFSHVFSADDIAKLDIEKSKQP